MQQKSFAFSRLKATIPKFLFFLPQLSFFFSNIFLSFFKIKKMDDKIKIIDQMIILPELNEVREKMTFGMDKENAIGRNGKEINCIETMLKKLNDQDKKDCFYKKFGNPITYSNLPKVFSHFWGNLLYFIKNDLDKKDKNIFYIYLIVCHHNRLKEDILLFTDKKYKKSIGNSAIISFDFSKFNNPVPPIDNSRGSITDNIDFKKKFVNVVFNGFPNKLNDQIHNNFTLCDENFYDYLDLSNIQNTYDKFSLPNNFAVLICRHGNARHNKPLELGKKGFGIFNRPLDSALTFLGFMQNEMAGKELNQYINNLEHQNINIQLISSELNRAQHTGLQILNEIKFIDNKLNALLLSNDDWSYLISYENPNKYENFDIDYKKDKDLLKNVFQNFFSETKTPNLYTLLNFFDLQAVQSLAKAMRTLDNKQTLKKYCDQKKDQCQLEFDTLMTTIFTKPQINWINDKISCLQSVDSFYQNRFNKSKYVELIIKTN